MTQCVYVTVNGKQYHFFLFFGLLVYQKKSISEEKLARNAMPT